MLLYFEQQVFLVLDEFSYFNKNIWRNQNKVISKRNIVIHLIHSSVL